MSYRYTTFAGYALPAQEPSHELGPGEHASPLISLPGGGIYDPWGSERVRPGARRLRVEGILTAATQAALLAAYADLRALVGTRNTLTRVSDDGLQTHTVTARLQTMETGRTAEWELQVPIRMDFALLAPVWSGTARSVTVSSGSTPVALTLPNAGNAPITDVAWTITAVAPGSIISMSLQKSGVWYWTFSAEIAAGTSLVVDCGARSVTNDGVDAYASFALSASNHKIADWCRLDSGNNTVTFGFLSIAGSATINAAYSDGWV